jgi:cyclophilin family peptidyl-prolyl cis-trans isomerase
VSPSNARRKQLQKLAERRAAERRRRRRNKAIAIATALVVAAAGGTFAFFAFTGNDKGTPSSPTPGPSQTLAAVACGAARPAAADVPKKTYDKAPKMTIDPKKTYTAVMKTSCGTIKLELDAKGAPNTVNSMVFLAGEKFFDGLTFHRIVKDFVIQGGDPVGDGTGGPGYKTVDKPPKGVTYKEGDLAMAKAEAEAPGTSGSQFFIVTGSPAALNAAGTYALIGAVTEGLDIAKLIEQLPAVGGGQDGAPAETVYIESFRIVVS